ncbi:MAG TPA: rhodanese-like domain-containing protein [Candidatus Binataceae bacterium]|nr:rhodanese-like domain-containing protein [Candidatus Binataceae bacterium]
MRLKLATTFAIALCAALAVAPAAPAHAFSLDTLLGNHTDQNNIKKIHVAELVALMHDPDAHVIIYDANLADVRSQYGIIPGAKLLSSSDAYNVAATLPADRNARLVFYCTNLH